MSGYTHVFQTPKLYCGGDIGDLTEVLQHIRTNIGEAPLVTVAMSMGRSAPSFESLDYYSVVNCEVSMALSQALSQAPRFSYFSIYTALKKEWAWKRG